MTLTIEKFLNLALEHHRAGRLKEAEALYRQVLQVQPNHAGALHCMGVIAYQLQRFDRAVDYYRRAIRRAPGIAEFHNNLGTAYREKGKLEEAVAQYRQALTLQPASVEAYYNLGNALKEQGKLEESVAQYRQALALRQDYIEAYNNLGEAIRDQGKFEEAVACYRQALAISPGNAMVHSNLILCLRSQCDPGALVRELKTWNDAHARPLATATGVHANVRDAEKPLRVGYVSAGFWENSSSVLVEPLLSAHDHTGMMVFVYSNRRYPERTGRSVRKMGNVWRDIVGLSDEAVARRIAADGIDVLVDLSGHAAGNRLLVFARKPAPVQATFERTGTTTGLSAMAYRLTDRYLSPPDSAEWFSEELIRLPGCFVCYRPPEHAPAVSQLPEAASGHVTFGSFNKLMKVTPSVVALWAEILRALPTARMILKDRTLADQAQRSRYLDLFAAHGIDKERVEIMAAPASYADHLALYERVDVGLDPFPYNGCTTTCEALWMGVPVVTLAGLGSYGRRGGSLLSAIGLTQLIAASPEAYVKIAVDLAKNRKALATLRAELRPMMAASPLCDAKAHAHAVEQAYRLMWRRWCERSQ